MKIKLKFLLALIVISVSLNSGFTVVRPLPSSGQLTLSVSDWPQDNSEPGKITLYENLSNIMLSKYNVIVKGVKHGFDTTFYPQVAVGTWPNLFIVGVTEPGKIIDEGCAKDITPEIKKLGWDRDIDPQVLSIISRKSRIYAVPLGGYYMGLLCRIDLFKKAGLIDANGIPKAPKTYDELLAYARIIKAKTGAAGFVMETSQNCGGWHFMNIAWSYGVKFETKTNGRWMATFNSPEGVAALDYVKSLAAAGVLPSQTLLDWSTGQEAFATGQAAMMFNVCGGQSLSYMVDTFKLNKDNVAIFSMPAGPEGRYSQLGGAVWMFTPYTTETQVEAGLKWLSLLGYSPTFNSDSITNMIKQYQQGTNLGYMIGPYGLLPYINKDYVNMYYTIQKPYINIKMSMVADYNNVSQVKLKPEEPIECQDLYKELDNCIQAVITDPSNANSKNLLDNAAADFQRNDLDKQKNYVN